LIESDFIEDRVACAAQLVSKAHGRFATSIDHFSQSATTRAPQDRPDFEGADNKGERLPGI